MDISNVPPINVFVHAERKRVNRQEHLQLNFSCFDELQNEIDDYRELEVQNEMTF